MFAVVQKADLIVGIATIVVGMGVGDKTVLARREVGC